MNQVLMILSSLIVLYLCTEMLVGYYSVKRLADFQSKEYSEKVSIIVPARNEEASIESALTSLLQLDYPEKEIIVVNDRSTDATGRVLDRFKSLHPELHLIHVTDLPSGWLGKNHALSRGAQVATGQWLLFTDADVIFDASALARAMTYLRVHPSDHLAALPEIHARGFFTGMFVAYFTIFFSMFFKPWKAPDRRSRFHVGIGAFNLIRRQVYEAIAGHRTIAMRPDDDMKLGKLVKEAGFRQDLVSAHDLISVEWYTSVREMIKGLEKNAYAGLDYRWYKTVAGVGGQALCFIWPFICTIVYGGVTQWIAMITVGVLALTFLINVRFHRAPFYHAFSWPVASLFIIGIMLNGLMQVVTRGGIVWRGTFYRSEDLRRW